MNALRTAALAAALISSLAACQARTPDSATAAKPAADTGIEGAITRNVDTAMSEAHAKLSTENVKLTENGRHAEITPKGDLIIDGKTIAVNAEQRQLLLEHRAHILEIASAGIEIGKQGAHLAGHAVSEAISGIFSGNTDRIEKSVEAQSQEMKRAAASLCDKLPAMYASQQRVAQAVPEFAPFATMKSTEQDKCHDDLTSDGKDATTISSSTSKSGTPDTITVAPGN
ncbi:DUF2884 family protein [Lysobacter sp. HA35]